METKRPRVGFSRRYLHFAIAAPVLAVAVYGVYVWQFRPPLFDRVIRNADSITAHRFISEDSGADWMMNSFEPAREPVALLGDRKNRFVAVLTSPPSEEPTACEPTPGVGLTARQGEHQVDVVICLNCGLLMFEMNGERVDGRYLPREATDELRSAFADTFPDDGPLQALARTGKLTHNL